MFKYYVVYDGQQTQFNDVSWQLASYGFTLER